MDPPPATPPGPGHGPRPPGPPPRAQPWTRPRLWVTCSWRSTKMGFTEGQARAAVQAGSLSLQEGHRMVTSGEGAAAPDSAPQRARRSNCSFQPSQAPGGACGVRGSRC
ncbi:unnamed protein product [Lepidochelys kempii]